MERIKLNDQLFDVFAKLSDGNPGALNACSELFNKTEEIQPNNFLGGLGNLLLLDTFGIYGTDIYILYNDICDRNIARMIAVLYATQLGFFDSRRLADIAHRQDYSGRNMIDVIGLYKQIKENYPEFDKNNAAQIK